jgi:hypothetical protein
MENINNEKDHIVDTKKMVSSVEWFSNQAYELFEQYSEGNFDRITLNKLMLQATEKAKAMHREEIKNAFTNGFISSRGSNRIADETFYNETYGGNK